MGLPWSVRRNTLTLGSSGSAPPWAWPVFFVMAVFVATANTNIITPSVVHYMLSFGLKPHEASYKGGWTLSAVALAQTLFNVPVYRLADRFGLVLIMTAVYIILGATCIAYGMAPSANALIISRFVMGIGGAGSLLPYNWLLIMAPPAWLDGLSAILRCTANLAYVIAPGLAYLFTTFTFKLGPFLFNEDRSPGYCLGIIFIIMAITCSFAPHAPPAPPRTGPSPGILSGSCPRLYSSNHAAAAILVMATIPCLILGGVQQLSYPMLHEHFGWKVAENSIMWLGLGAVQLVVSLWLIIRAHVIDERWTGAVGLLLLVASNLVLTAGYAVEGKLSITQVALTGIVLSVAYTLLTTASLSLYQGLWVGEGRPPVVYTSIYLTLQLLSRFIGPLYGHFLYTSFGVHVFAIISFALALASAVVSLSAWKHLPRLLKIARAADGTIPCEKSVEGVCSDLTEREHVESLEEGLWSRGADTITSTSTAANDEGGFNVLRAVSFVEREIEKDCADHRGGHSSHMLPQEQRLVEMDDGGGYGLLEDGFIFSRARTAAHVEGILQSMASLTEAEKEGLVIDPDEGLRRARVTEAVRKGRMFVCLHHGVVVSFIKTFIITDSDEVNRIVLDELGAAGNCAREDAYFDNADHGPMPLLSHWAGVMVPGHWELLEERQRQVLVYQGSAHTSVPYRRYGLHTRLLTFSFASLQLPLDAEEVVLLFGQINHDMHYKRREKKMQIWANMLRVTYGRSRIHLHRFCYATHKPIFDEEGNVRTDIKGPEGTGNVVVWKRSA